MRVKDDTRLEKIFSKKGYLEVYQIYQSQFNDEDFQLEPTPKFIDDDESRSFFELDFKQKNNEIADNFKLYRKERLFLLKEKRLERMR